MDLNCISKSIAFFLLFLSICYGEDDSHQLSVISPPSLKQLFLNGRMTFSLANFGQVPYGKKLLGQIILSEPSHGCTEFSFNNGSNKTEAIKKNVFLMVDRGNCTFVSKARSAELAGAKMLIVVDDKDEISENVVMVEDGHGNEIYIPTILIRKEDGEKIRQTINKGEKVELLVSFVLKKYDKLKYIFWLDVDNRESFKLISEFKEYHQVLESKGLVTFQPHYQLFPCSWCKDFETMSNLCLAQGAYCANDPDQKGPGTGIDSMMEIVRQICFFQSNPKKWWDYMERVDLECIKPSEYQICSTKIENDLKVNTQRIEQCFKSSFNPVLTDMNDIKSIDNTYENKLLEKEMEALNEYNTHLWPAITIQDIAYTGNLESDDILSEFCASLNSPPSICSKYSEEFVESSDGGDGPGVFFIFLIIFVIIIFIAIMYFVYQRIVKKELSQNVGSEVNTMVNQYIAFYEKQEKK